jgi:Cu(I)/Ag(I) efflux system membrane protein CusA/SilA
MIERIIELSARNRFLVFALTALMVVGALQAVRTLPVDAIPDLSDVQVIVLTEFPGQAPQVVEDQVTYPLSTSLLAVPYATTVRGYSFFGFSLVYVIFEDGTDLYWARSRVLEYLDVARNRLPATASPQLGPDATGVGWVYQYSLSDFGPRARVLRAALDADGDGDVGSSELPPPTLQVVGGAQVYGPDDLAGLFASDDPPLHGTPERWLADCQRYVIDGFDADRDGYISPPELQAAARFRGMDLAELRSVQDWVLRYDLTAIEGVAEVASVGGFVRQYQVEVDPERLRAFGVTLGQVRRAIQRSNVDVGGKLIELAETEYMVRGRGYLRSLEDLEAIPVGVSPDTHAPVLLRQLARVQIGPESRRGLVDMNGDGEVVSGIVLLRYGENALQVIDRVEQRLEELKPSLPPGVEIHVSYDRSELIERAVSTLEWKLGEEILIVSLVCIVFLLHLRSALVPILALPIGVLISLLIMRLLGVEANIMSLGGIAIAIGVMVDASVVMVENLHKHKERDPHQDQLTAVIAASKEVGPALFFSLAIITVSFLPVFTLEGQAGRLFGPLAWTKTLAMAASAVLAITLVPALMVGLVKGRIRHEADNPISRVFIASYRPVIRGVLARPRLTVAAAALVLVVSIWPATRLGEEFIPPLNEGELLYMPTTPPGLSITEARELLQVTDRLIVAHPQVESVLGKIGRADTATDPAPLTMIETLIRLTPEDSWPAGQTIEGIADELDRMVQLPGMRNSWTMPIRTRIDMLATGIKTPVGVKLLGDDLEQLATLGPEIEAVLQAMPETRSVVSERVTGGNFLDIDIDRAAAARYGLTVGDVQDVIASAIGGMNVTRTVEGLARYPVNLRFPRELRNDLASLERVAVPTPMGHTVALGQVAAFSFAEGAPGIKSENARQTAWIFVTPDGDDLGGYVAAAKQAVRSGVALPPGVSIEWSGQYESMQRVRDKLWVAVPLTIGIILVLLYLHFRRAAPTLIVMGTLPFALVGSVWLLWASGYNWSVAVAVGLIALAGLAAETGVVMLVYLDEAWHRWDREGRLVDLGAMKGAITEGAVDRVRPKLMTVTSTLLGLLPIMFGTETGVRVMKRIAAPMVGGLVSSTLLTLVIIPAVYLLWRQREARQRPDTQRT